MPISIQPVSIEWFLLPVETRMPLKFGSEVTTHVTCLRVRVTVEDSSGARADGWGETPLSVQWVWPSSLAYSIRHDRLLEFSRHLGRALAVYPGKGHPIELGFDFQKEVLPMELNSFNDSHPDEEDLPWLAALVCLSAFDIALHDAAGNLVKRPVYELYGKDSMGRSLDRFLTPEPDSAADFQGLYPEQFLLSEPDSRLPVWHLVGGLDPLTRDEAGPDAPNDGYPVTLEEWIQADGLNCLKIKLRGNDAEWDYARLLAVGKMAINNEVDWLTADFNCTVSEVGYVNEILDRLMLDAPRIHGMVLYVEQPFPYELEEHRLDVHSLSARKPLFLDESAHDWTQVRLGRRLGWTGVALKTCKTQTGALLSACWAKAHGMTLMVQDLTNPMLAQLPHVQLAARVGTIMGVESNAMQFYPEASLAEAVVHPGLYQRRQGVLDLTTIQGPGFGYRLDDIHRELPTPDGSAERG